MEGLASRLSEPGFVEYVLTFKMCCFVETFTSPDFDFAPYFSDYVVLHSPAVRLSHYGRRSGGVVVLIKKSFSEHVSQLPYSFDNMIVVKISSPGLDDLILFVVYIPPMYSNYYRNKEMKCNIFFLEDMLLSIQEEFPNSNIIICGDFNARTSNWNLHTDDNSTEEEFDHCSCPNGAALRRSEDVITNHFGEILKEFCKVHHMYILNGSNEGDAEGKLTYVSNQGDSVIDYCLSMSTNICKNLTVTVEPRVESSHMPLVIKIGPQTRSLTEERVAQTVTRMIWNSEKEDEVLQNMESIEFKTSLSHADAYTETDVNTSVRILTTALLRTADTMQLTLNTSNQKGYRQADWFDEECKDSKLIAKKSLTTYKRTLKRSDKMLYVKNRNDYKRLIREKKKNHREAMSKYILKNLHNSNKFWHIIRKKSRKRAQLPDIKISTWKSYFENLFNQNVTAHFIPESSETNMMYDEVLDADISPEEIELAITKLRNGRAPGLDETPGELIRIGRKYLIPFFTKLFNAIYDRQDFPEEWCRSVIVPIYKSGNPLDPHNYRGISLLSVISKLFSSILTNRLQNWTEENNKICVEQAGFR